MRTRVIRNHIILHRQWEKLREYDPNRTERVFPTFDSTEFLKLQQIEFFKNLKTEKSKKQTEKKEMVEDLKTEKDSTDYHFINIQSLDQIQQNEPLLTVLESNHITKRSEQLLRTLINHCLVWIFL